MGVVVCRFVHARIVSQCIDGVGEWVYWCGIDTVLRHGVDLASGHGSRGDHIFGTEGIGQSDGISIKKNYLRL